MGFNPRTLKWIGGNINAPKFTIHGKIEDYNVDINYSEEDFKRIDADGVLVGLGEVEIGTLQFLIDQARGHGVMPAWRQSNQTSSEGSATTGAVTANNTSPKVWECPEHGANNSIKPARFGKGLQCSRWIKVNAPDEDPPNWAQNRMSEFNDELRWYCRHREIPLPPRN